MTGSMSAPLFDGYLDFDSATVKAAMIGTTFRFSEEKIPVDSNVIRFDRYSIYGVNDNPLEITGTVDMRSLSNIALDLGLKADNMQVVGNDKRRGSDLYGKAFISVDAQAKGDMHLINARANVAVKEGTNVTYVMPEASSQLSSQSTGDMVRFVNFADTTAVATADTVASPGMMLNLTAILNVEEGSVIGVDLSSNGQDRVQLQSNGVLDFSMNPLGDTRTTGRLNITGGFVRYTPPLMSEKLFDFQEGSYVAFNGDMANPQLHVTAIDVIKANVTQDGQNSRLVNFDVILRVNGTLNEMDVAFDLETDEDITVRNELQSMSPEQRANQAMNLLLYNMYTGPGTKGNANISGNPLYSFLSSQLNTWMANNVKGVDISFGIDQYERTLDGASSTTTSYSYKVSKSFLDDRFKVVVGGNYSTDADANENLSQNLVNDISFEYLLNKSGTMYVRL
ncbi:MAG: translocation/assembly module TamB, partial [Muribaculaceae bacterium]|nr:translocation/assembly module TamB [Muribaculaceae bacterium]